MLYFAPIGQVMLYCRAANYGQRLTLRTGYALFAGHFMLNGTLLAMRVFRFGALLFVSRINIGLHARPELLAGHASVVGGDRAQVPLTLLWTGSNEP